MNPRDPEARDIFFKDSFSVDHCLSKYTHKTDLETLRRELKYYGAELQQQMSEILKTETEAIVNLAEFLTNLNTKIENLCAPICQLREEIMTVSSLIENAESSYSITLHDIKNNNRSQNNINLKMGIISSTAYVDKLMKGYNESLDDLLVLERIVTNFSFQKNYMELLGILTADIEGIIKNVEARLVKIIDEKFLEAFRNENSDVLSRCLRMYENLGKQKEAQETFRIKVVKPYLEKVFSGKYIDKMKMDLDKIYKKVLSFMNKKMNVFSIILAQNPDLQSFNFVKYSFWKEFDRQSRVGLPNITAPGNPELFQKRFRSTWNILHHIALKCGDINLLREDETFQEHLKRFNLPVYFEICYQKIAGTFESDLLIDKDKIYASENEISCVLKPTLALWLALSHCFSKDVYIDQLGDQFLKLSMMLLSRYLNWFQTSLKGKSACDNQSWENFVMDSLKDLSVVKNLIAIESGDISAVEGTLFSIMNPNMWFLVIRVFKVNKKCIDDVKEDLIDNLIDIKFQNSAVHLQSVGSIPRLYRRTNRSAPKGASPYIVDALKPVLNFNRKFGASGHQQSREIIEKLIMKIAKQYLSLVQEVLQSVCKTEETLRRLKSRNLPSPEDTSQQSDTMSDEMKIREQIKYDGLYFLVKLTPLAPASSKDVMDSMRKEIS